MCLSRDDQLLLTDCMKDRDRDVERRIVAGASTACRDECGRTPMHIAVLFSAYRVMKVLLTYSANCSLVDENGCTALWLAVERNNVEAAAMLLEYGSSPLERHAVTKRPLFDLAVEVDVEGTCVVDVLIKHGANPWQKAADGTTAYTRARKMKGPSFPIIAYMALDTVVAKEAPEELLVPR